MTAAHAPGVARALELDPDRSIDKLEKYVRAQCATLGPRDVLVLNVGAHYAFDVHEVRRAAGTTFQYITLHHIISMCTRSAARRGLHFIT